MGNGYIIHVNDETLAFRIWKEGKELPFDACQNIKWGVQNVLATIQRTESEEERLAKLQRRSSVDLGS